MFKPSMSCLPCTYHSSLPVPVIHALVSFSCLLCFGHFSVLLSMCWEVNNRKAILFPLPNPPFMLCFVLLPVKTLNMPKAELTPYQYISSILWFLWASLLYR